METVRRSIFGLLVAGCVVGMLEAFGFRLPVYWIASVQFFFGIVSPFGLAIWSMIFLEKEKLLTRFALAIVMIFMAALLVVIMRAPG